MNIDLSKTSSNAATADAFARMMGLAAAPGENVQKIKLNLLHPYPDQPFHPYTEERLRELAADIAENGVMNPIIVRPFMGTDYQILAGHNRVNASKLSGLDEIPAIVRDVDDDTAQLILVNTNLNQRDKLLSSEKAFAYKMQLEAMKRQGSRSDLTSAPVGRKLNRMEARDILSEKVGDSREQIRRYICLTELTTPLLGLVDNDALPLRVGVMLSALKCEKQELLWEFLSSNELTRISIAQAEVIIKNGDVLDETKLYRLFFGLKQSDVKASSFKLPSSVVSSYFPNKKKAEVETELIKILDNYFKRQ